MSLGCPCFKVTECNAEFCPVDRYFAQLIRCDRMNVYWSLVKTFGKFFVILVLNLHLACASVMTGNDQEISVDADVANVEVYWGEHYLGNTPLFSLTLPRKPGQDLIFRKKGYQSVKARLKTKMSSQFWWNIPFTVLGITGMSTDYGNGSAFEITPGRIWIKMKPLDPKSQQPENSENLELFELLGKRNLQKERVRHQQGPWSDAFRYLETR